MSNANSTSTAKRYPWWQIARYVAGHVSCMSRNTQGTL